MKGESAFLFASSPDSSLPSSLIESSIVRCRLPISNSDDPTVDNVNDEEADRVRPLPDKLLAEGGASISLKKELSSGARIDLEISYALFFAPVVPSVDLTVPSLPLRKEPLWTEEGSVVFVLFFILATVFLMSAPISSSAFDALSMIEKERDDGIDNIARSTVLILKSCLHKTTCKI